MAYKSIAPELRGQIINRIKNDGISVLQASQEHGISDKTIYKWLSAPANLSKEVLKVNRLKRENEELQRLLGKAMVEIERSKKNSAHYAF